MNINELWSGTEYAWYDGKPRGIDTPTGARKVVVQKAYKRQEYGNQRASGYAIVTVADDSNGSTPLSMKYKSKGERIEVRARDIVDFWEDYEHRIAEKLAAQTERERRLKAIEEQEAGRRLGLIQAFADKTGVPVEWISVEYGYFKISNNDRVREWLGVNV